MADSLLRTDKEIAEIYERHNKMVYRVCFAYMKNTADTEDMVQDAFYQMIKTNVRFENAEHEKAWLIRTATNLCKNNLKHWWRKRENIDDIDNYESIQTDNDFETDDILEIIMNLPDKYKTVIYLYYYEGYNSVEISKILKKPQSTIRNHLHEARELLRNRIENLGGDFDEK